MGGYPSIFLKLCHTIAFLAAHFRTIQQDWVYQPAWPGCSKWHGLKVQLTCQSVWVSVVWLAGRSRWSAQMAAPTSITQVQGSFKGPLEGVWLSCFAPTLVLWSRHRSVVDGTQETQSSESACYQPRSKCILADGGNKILCTFQNPSLVRQDMSLMVRRDKNLSGASDFA